MESYEMPVGEKIGTGDAPPVDFVVSAPTLGDVMQNGASEGRFEVVIGGDHGTVYVWDTGDPTNTSYHYTPSGATAISSAPALADLDESDTNQNLDLVVADSQGRVYAFYYNGTTPTSLWSVHLGDAPVTSPIIGDANSDDALEVITARMVSGKVFILDADGSPVPLTAGTAGQISGPPAIGDVDRDGNYEIIAVDDKYLYLWHGYSTIPSTILLGYPFDRGNVRRDGVMTTVSLYPVAAVNQTYTDPHYSFDVQLVNRGTGPAYNVAVQLVGYEHHNLITVTTRLATVDEIPPGGGPVTVGPFVLDLTNYDWETPIYVFFDMIYEDAQGSEYLIHR
jgi:hypothetical protein